jgi:FKBP-type peptidyl-prolyl cis-trans isomerase
MISFKSVLLVVSAGAFLLLTACEKTVKLDNDVRRGSYAIGQQIGQNMKSQPVDLDGDAISEGIRDALGGKPSKLKPEEIQAAMMQLQKAAMEKMKATGDKSAKAGQDYLDANKKKDGWKATASGLQYFVEKDGTGKSPSDKDTVTVRYTGTLTTGEKFDSTEGRKDGADLPVNGVIKGWSEALKMMKPGAKWKLAIPADLAYGPQGRPGIPPNSVLLFDIELVKIK